MTAGRHTNASGVRATLPPVPTGIQRLLRLAAADEGFRRELLKQREQAAESAGLGLTASEQAIVAAIPAAQLTAMIAKIAQALFRTFVAKAGSRDRYAAAVQGATERIQEIDQIIRFSQQNAPGQP